MKNKFLKLISSLLVLAFLVSCMAVFVYADTTEDVADEEVGNENTNLFVNRTFDEGWNYANGFLTSSVGSVKFTVDYEETKDFTYNYFARAESTDGVAGYVKFDFAASSAVTGGTVFEIDVKTDDYCNVGSPIIYFTAKNTSNASVTHALAGISDNNLMLVPEGTYSKGSNAATYAAANAQDTWIHLAFCTTVNQRICPECSTVHTIVDVEKQNDNTELICTDENGNKLHENTTYTVAQMIKAVTTRTYFGYKETFDATKALKAPARAETADLNNTYYIDVISQDVTTVATYCIGLPKKTDSQGQSFCYDNVSIYNGETAPVKVSGYGANVDVNQAKTEQIIGSEEGKLVKQYIEEGLVMKVGLGYCIDKNEKREIFKSEDGTAYGAPVNIDGEVYIPLQAVLDWIGYPMYQHEDGLSFDISTESGSTFITIGRKTATVNGELVELGAAPGLATSEETGLDYVVVSKDDISKIFSGYYATYDDMGLIVVSTKENLFDRSVDLEIMLETMKSFIFDTVTASEYYNLIKENTNDFQHPYILTDQSYFASLFAAYKLAEGDEGYDKDLKAYLDGIVKDAEEIFNTYATLPAEEEEEEEETVPDGDTSLEETPVEEEEEEEGLVILVPDISGGYKHLKYTLENPYVGKGNNGYDFAGRNQVLVQFTADMKLLALAYQVTGDMKYAELAYEIAMALGEWDHWAPAYFVDCADATANYAITYDWLYNVWQNSGYNLSEIESYIYTNGLSMGYNFSIGVTLNAGISSNQGVYAIYNSETNSWNSICTSGMVIASLALIGSDYIRNGNDYAGSESEDSSATTLESGYVKAATYILENNIKTLIELGLDMYAPDGSFIESADNWAHATEAFMLMVWALETSTGETFGFENTWGMDKTFYFAFQTEYKIAPTESNPTGYTYWNYHSAYSQVLNTGVAFYAARMLGDDVIAALRVKQIANKGVSIWDVLAYDSKFITASLDATSLPLDYSLESCEGLVSRSGWGEDDLFVGIMGNRNDATGGQIDSGNFIYANKGFTWFGDLGAEDDGVKNYRNVAQRRSYFRENGEGANVVLITTKTLASTIPYGQLPEAGGTITDYYTNEYGMYAIIDNASVYAGKATFAYRGILLTNDRRTVVIQDDITFGSAQACTWVAQVMLPSQNIQLADYNKTAYLTQEINGEQVTIRVTILEPGGALEFQKKNATTALLPGTHNAKYSGGAEDDPELDRTGLSRLVIEQNEMLTFKCAIAIEVVSEVMGGEPVEYEYTDITYWGPDMVSEKFAATVVDENAMISREIYNILTYTEEAYSYSDPFGRDIKAFFRAMAFAADSVKAFEPTGQISKFNNIETAFESKYKPMVAQYNYLRNEMNSFMNMNKSFAMYLCGYN
ncbi:MAG: hypothetical protein IJY23_02295 [Clostridia bacterium]|nr:hypothetical protein [Clostridia bacterium]